MESRYLIDYLTVTSKIHSPMGMAELFGLEGLPWEECCGLNNYRDGFRSGSIRVSYNGRNGDEGVCISLSGQGCREFETHGHGDYDRIFAEVLENKSEMNITRMDVAFDDKDGLIDWERLCWDTIQRDDKGKPTEFVSKFQKARVDWGIPADTEGNTIYWGSKHSQFFIRAYDKAKERGFYDQHWIRFELQMRKPYPMNWIKNGYTSDKLREGLMGVLRGYIRYVEDPGSDSNMRRWPMKEYWAKFIDGVEAVRLFDKPGVEYNMENLEAFVIRQAGNAITAYLEICGDDVFHQRLRERGTVMSPKYAELIRRYGKGKVGD